MFRVDDSYLGVSRVKLESGKNPLNESSEYGDASRINVRVKLLII
jgi:hypothetical protein